MLLDKWALIQVGVHRDCCQSQGQASEQSMPHRCGLQSLPALGTLGPTVLIVMSTEPAAWQLLTFLQRLSSQYFSKKHDMLSLKA